MAKYKYGIQKLIQNDLQQCINSYERMINGGIGIADELVYDTCKRALEYINELEAKLADVESVRHGHWIQSDECFKHSDCGYGFEHEGYTQFFHFCPNCGAKMDGEVDDYTNSQTTI